MSRAVVVMLPGLGGSVLAQAGETVWPGTLAEYVNGFGEARFTAFLGDGVAATDVLRTSHGYPVYEPLLRALRAFGYEERAGAPRELIAFGYDWRRSIAAAARALADRLDAAGDADIHLVAHSLGGLVARHFLESPDHGARAPRRRVRLLATVGTPHRGAPSVLPAIMGARRFHYMTRDQVRRLTADPRYPSAYELLPPPGEPFVWRDTVGLAPVPVYRDAAAARALGLDSARLAAGAAILSELRSDWTGPVDPGTARYICFAGAQQVTLDHWLLSDRGPAPAELAGAGDGRVPFASAVLAGLQHQPVSGAHDDITEDAGLLGTLAQLLPHDVAVAPPAVPLRLSLRDTTRRPGEGVRVSLLAPAGGVPAGTVRLTHREAPDGASLAAPVTAAVTATPTDAVHVEMPALGAPGLWEAAFAPSSGPAPLPLAVYVTNDV